MRGPANNCVDATTDLTLVGIYFSEGDLLCSCSMLNTGECFGLEIKLCVCVCVCVCVGVCVCAITVELLLTATRKKRTTTIQRQAHKSQMNSL